MSDRDVAWLGLFFLIPHLLSVYVAFKIRHVQSGNFWVWAVGWLALTLAILCYSYVRTYSMIEVLTRGISINRLRFTASSSASVLLLIFVLSMYFCFPSQQRFWTDVHTDARWVWAGLRRVGWWLYWRAAHLMHRWMP